MSEAKLRARDLNIPFEGTPGPLNAITDVEGVEVGHTTLISGEGELRVGAGPVRTGVTAILPRGKDALEPCFAGWFSLNGNGEMTGTTWVEESGFLEGPVMITNTHSVGIARDAVIAWQVKELGRLRLNAWKDGFWSLPVVGETYDGYLNDINGFHVKEEHVFGALDGASTGPVAEGNVGGGTGMICYQFKGGIGTSSRKLSNEDGGYTVGVLAQCNFGMRHQLLVAGAPVGREIAEDLPGKVDEIRMAVDGPSPEGPPGDTGSIIIVVATDAPLLSHQLKRLARRAGMGLARTGSIAGNSSGDIFIAFSTANAQAAEGTTAQVEMLNNNAITPLFGATAYATEEAIINALVAADTMVGRDNHRVVALPHGRLKEVLAKYNRLAE